MYLFLTDNISSSYVFLFELIFNFKHVSQDFDIYHLPIGGKSVRVPYLDI